MSPAIITLTTEQQVPLSVTFQTATGNPATVTGTPSWTVDNANVVDLVVAEDGYSVMVVSKEIGNCFVSAQANNGTKLISGLIGVNVVAPQAEIVVITPGNLEPKPVVITVNTTAQADGSTLITGQGAPNKIYRILAADAVTGPYADIGTTSADSTGAFSFVDMDASNHVPRFYSAVWP